MEVKNTLACTGPVVDEQVVTRGLILFIQPDFGLKADIAQCCRFFHTKIKEGLNMPIRDHQAMSGAIRMLVFDHEELFIIHQLHAVWQITKYTHNHKPANIIRLPQILASANPAPSFILPLSIELVINGLSTRVDSGFRVISNRRSNKSKSMTPACLVPRLRLSLL